MVDERKKMIVLLSLFLLSLLPGHSQAQAAAPTQAQAAAPTQVRAAAPTQVRAAAPTQVRAAAPAQVQAPAPASNVDLQKVITQLNTAATKFVSAQADFTWDQYTAAVQESDLQSGTIYFERKKGVTLTAAHIKKDNGKDAPKTVAYRDGEVQLYEPTIKQLTILKAGANHAQLESFLTLGFGGSGTDLLANWKVSLMGTENLSGVSVVKLDLVPLQQKVLDMFPHVTIWIDPTRGISYKQLFYEPGGDKRTATYNNIRYNQPIAGDIFEIQPAPGTNRVVK